MSITVLGGGLLTTVQDRGRSGYQQFGVPVSGVVDPRAMSVANILVGNPEDAAVLECTMMGPMLQFDQDTVFAVTGGDLRPSLEFRGIPRSRRKQDRFCSFLASRADAARMWHLQAAWMWHRSWAAVPPI